MMWVSAGGGEAGAIHILHLLPDGGVHHAQKLAAGIGGLGISNDDLVVVYSSDTLMWATRAFWVLRHAGHDRVRMRAFGEAGASTCLDQAEVRIRYRLPAPPQAP